MCGVGCDRRWRGEEPVAIETASMELARLAGEPLTVGKEVSRGEPGRTSCDDSKLPREGQEGRGRRIDGERAREGADRRKEEKVMKWKRTGGEGKGEKTERERENV